MDPEEKLQDFKKHVDLQINLFLERKFKEAGKIHPQAALLIKEIQRFINIGGKRVRPLFLYLGYLSCGGKKEREIIKIAAVPEFLHTFALMHDDIIDRSDLRRGEMTSHIAFSKSHQEQKMTGDKDHYGLSSALLAGDVALILADFLFTNSKFPAAAIKRAQKYWELVKFEVLHGEYLDVLFSFQEKVTDKDIWSVLNYKTAKYTIQRPLQIGASLANASKEQLNALGNYGSYLGQAFQIKDDINGVFGDEEKIGKSVISDLVEGKKTLLILETLKKASPGQKKILHTVLGNNKATFGQLQSAREVIITTGALASSEKTVIGLVNKAKLSLNGGKFTPDGKKWLLAAADYLQLT